MTNMNNAELPGERNLTKQTKQKKPNNPKDAQTPTFHSNVILLIKYL